ncbi:MAG: acetyl-CoA carboxylase biotin carboxylase subunit [Candidatus Heimdallarchaeaceae archaeon]
MYESVLVANRGEIAVRIIRACRLLNLKTIALYNSDDSSSLHVKMADEAYCLGEGTVQETYLNINKIKEIIHESGAEAVHPGYGFLSESAVFARTLEKIGVTFIGPTSRLLKQLGDKMKAKKAAEKAGLPIVPGSKKHIFSLEQAEEVIEEIGYPIIIKSAFGGGGKGMEIVDSPSVLEISLLGCQSISERFFGRKEIIIEKYVQSPRHVEIQFLGDKYNNYIHLGDRECSIQRSHQKIIEEAPSFLSNRERNSLGKKVCILAEKLNYTNIGTAEFLWKDGKLYFNEINPRIQVEHPVTEMITKVDLVKQQLRIASGEEIELKQTDIEFTGHAIEFRINAEDPLTFYPQTGTISNFTVPGGNSIRFDNFLSTSYSLSNKFDSLLGKLIVWGNNRKEAIEKSRLALQELTISGVLTNIPLHQAIVETPEFKNREVSTDFLEKSKISLILEHFEKMKLAAAFRVYNLQKVRNKSFNSKREKSNIDYNKWKEQSKREQQGQYP